METISDKETGKLGEIYLDLVFLINFIMDWILLWSVGLIMKLSVSYWRLTGGATIGAIYAIMLLFPPLGFLSTLIVKLIFSFIMVGVAYFWQSWRFYLKILAMFYLVSFVAGGGVMGILYLAKSQEAVSYNGILALNNLPVLWLLAGLAVLLFIILIGNHMFRKNFLKALYTVPIQTRFGDFSIQTTGFVDTGNQLRDPISQRPVIVMEYSLMKKWLPQEMAEILGEAHEPDWEKITRIFSATPWETRIRLLPFHSLGREKGILMGLMSDQVSIKEGNINLAYPQVIIGIYPGVLCPDRQFRALLHPELLNMDSKARKEVA